MIDHTIKYLFICMLFLYGCDKYEISEDQQMSFVKYYGLTTENEGIDIHPINDGYLIIGNTNDDVNNSNIVLFTTDYYGNITGEIKTIGTTNNDYVNKVVPVEDNNFLIIASTQQNANNVDLYLIKINHEGETLWETRYDSEFNNEGLDAVLWNNQYIIAGYVSDEEGNTQSWNARYTFSGSLINERTTNSVENQKIVSIAVHDDQPYVCGQIINGDPANYDIFHAGLTETGRLFGIINYENMRDGSQNLNEFAVDLSIDENGNRLILGYYEDNGQSIPFLVNYTPMNNTVQKDWELFISDQDIQQVTGISKKDNEILILTNTLEVTEEQGVKIYRTSMNADNYTSFEYGENDIQLRGNRILHLSDGVSMLGTSELGDNSSIILLKLKPGLTLQ